MDRAPYHANPRATAVIDKCVHDMPEWDNNKEHPSPWGSPCTLVATKNGSHRFCVDCRHTLHRHLVRKNWYFPNPDSCLDEAGSVKFISIADILTVFRPLPVAEDHIDRTAFVTPAGNFCFKRRPFGVCNAPWLFQPVMCVTFGHRGPDSGVATYMNDAIFI